MPILVEVIPISILFMLAIPAPDVRIKPCQNRSTGPKAKWGPQTYTKTAW
jgi:hypothetical protein